MSAQDVETVMKLAFCSEEEARKALSETVDIVSAVGSILVFPETRGNPKPKILTPQQEDFAKIRKDMEVIEASITMSSQSDSSSRASQRNPARLQEEMLLRSDCTQSSHLATLGEEVQIPGTACQ
jgi:hypothetical protein